jgi:hypothetical protein
MGVVVRAEVRTPKEDVGVLDEGSVTGTRGPEGP